MSIIGNKLPGMISKTVGANGRLIERCGSLIYDLDGIVERNHPRFVAQTQSTVLLHSNQQSHVTQVPVIGELWWFVTHHPGSYQIFQVVRHEKSLSLTKKDFCRICNFFGCHAKFSGCRIVTSPFR
jgi:hypothetical protein